MWAILRCLENLPIIGHMIAAIYACAGLKFYAERAGLKATWGIILGILNFPAEIFDEIGRKRTPKMYPEAKFTPRPNWMKAYRRRRLSHLCLPGTHQSCTYTFSRKLKALPLIEGWSQCQTLDITAQLEAGVRFLDFRLMDDDVTEEIWLHHNVVLCIKFKAAIDAVRDFLSRNPSEIIGIWISNDGKKLDWGKVAWILNEYVGTRLIPEYMADMAIGDILDYRKNIVLFGDVNVPYSWRSFQHRWPNKASPEDLRMDLQHMTTSLAEYNQYTLYWYKAECTPDAATIVRSTGGIQGLLVSNRVDEKFDFLADLAATANQAVYDVIHPVRHLPFNMLSVDHVTDQVIGHIIALNKQGMVGAGPASAVPSLRGSTLSGSTVLSGSSYLNRSQSSNLVRAHSGNLNRSYAGANTMDSMMEGPESPLLSPLSQSSSLFRYEEDETDHNTTLLEVRETPL